MAWAAIGEISFYTFVLQPRERIDCRRDDAVQAGEAVSETEAREGNDEKKLLIRRIHRKE